MNNEKNNQFYFDKNNLFTKIYKIDAPNIVQY